ncbi:MAG: helix-turn-helix transcriptional regulator, partial [Erysipelotrichaceae bacterium]|nr:helix-turn-helix transcriptional regulator [Erysipelotrichaceae bacterium]
SFCFVQGETDRDVLKEKCETLISFGKRYMSLNPVIIISDLFSFYQACNVVTELYDSMRKLRYYSGKIFYQDQLQKETVDTSPSLNESQILWYFKKRDSAGYSEYLSSILENCNGSEQTLDHLRRELINIYINHFRDDGMSSNTIFMDPNIIALDEKSTTSTKAFMNYAEGLFNLQQIKLQEQIDSEDIIIRAKRYIDENYHENIDRNDVAAVAFVTPNYLSKLFKSSMNINLREYINQLRIEEAKRLLLSTSMSVSEIASYVGYFNISYFSTVFHKIVGVSPFDWRTEGGNENETK